MLRRLRLRLLVRLTSFVTTISTLIKLEPTLASSRKTTFRGDVFRLVSGTAGAQVIGLLATPIITRIFAPEAFGVAAVFASVTSIFVVIACGRYDLSILLPDKDSEAANQLGLSVLCAFALATCLCFLTWLCGAELLNWFNLSALVPYRWLIPATILIGGIYNALNYWNTRTKHFSRLSIAQVSNSICANGSKLVGGHMGFVGGGTLLLSQFSGLGLSTIVLGGQIVRDNGRLFFECIRWPKMWTGLKRYRKFPLFSSWAALLNTLSWQLPVFMLGIFFSPLEVGFYALGFRMLQFPMSLIGGAIGKVFLQQSATAKNDGILGVLVEQFLQRLLIFGLIPMIVLMVFGKELFSMAFGSNWSMAGGYVEILSPWAYVWFVASPLSGLFAVLEMQSFELKFNLVLLVSRFVALLIGGIIGSSVIAIALFSCSGFFIYGYLIFKVTKHSGGRWKQILLTPLSIKL